MLTKIEFLIIKKMNTSQMLRTRSPRMISCPLQTINPIVRQDSSGYIYGFHARIGKRGCPRRRLYHNVLLSLQSLLSRTAAFPVVNLSISVRSLDGLPPVCEVRTLTQTYGCIPMTDKYSFYRRK